MLQNGPIFIVIIVKICTLHVNDGALREFIALLIGTLNDTLELCNESTCF